MSGQKGKVHLGPNASSSAHYRGRVVNGSGAMATTSIIIIIIKTNYYKICTNQSCMALALVRCSIEANQGGTQHARARVNLVSWEWRSHALLFMVPLGLPSASFYVSNHCIYLVPIIVL